MVISQVLNGAYKGYGLKTTLKGELMIQKWSEKHVVNDTTVESYEVISSDAGKASVGRTVGLGMLFGTLGAVAGASSKKDATTTVKVTWKDGQKSIIELTKTDYKTFLKNCPL